LPCPKIICIAKKLLPVRPKNDPPDKIVELMTDTAGDPIRPYQRKAIYRIGTSIDFRDEYGKLVFWRLDCYEEATKYLNGKNG